MTDYIIDSENGKDKDRPFGYLSYQNDRFYLVRTAGLEHREEACGFNEIAGKGARRIVITAQFRQFRCGFSCPPTK